MLKGARLFEFEAISHLLEQKTHQTVLEITLMLLHITYRIPAVIAAQCKLMAMVKAFSYGSGALK